MHFHRKLEDSMITRLISHLRTSSSVYSLSDIAPLAQHGLSWLVQWCRTMRLMMLAMLLDVLHRSDFAYPTMNRTDSDVTTFNMSMTLGLKNSYLVLRIR